jgi:GTPase
VENNNQEVTNITPPAVGPQRSGFVSIVGRPNVGKSTLMNVLVGEKLSIITSKAQTTRHRIMGILNGEHNGTPFQLVYSDTPGVLKPAYKLHETMMGFVRGSLEDADIVLFMTEAGENPENHDVIDLLRYVESPILFVINKIDLISEEDLNQKLTIWKEKFPLADFFLISALNQTNIEPLFEAIINRLPHHPPYFPTDELTDKPERFFASEIVREKIFLNYKQEIPYSTEVVVIEFKEKKDLIVIRIEILVERPSQKGIIIGDKGSMLKKIGTEARADMEAFFGKQVFLEQFVKVESDWRNRESILRRFGYQE